MRPLHSGPVIVSMSNDPAPAFAQTARDFGADRPVDRNLKSSIRG